MENRIGFGPRLGAFVIDIVLTWILAVVLSKMFPAFMYETASSQLSQAIEANPFWANNFDDRMMELCISTIRISFLAIFARLIIFLPEIFFAASPGKMLLKLHIAKANEEEASRIALLGRYALKHCSKIFSVLAFLALAGLFNALSSICGFVIFVGCFFAAGDKHQALHDIVLDTAVFKNSQEE